jgi:crotonobetainyl-CoA:carnitine CoA-transferase CaiB-like acyl-CoA transferase
MHVPALTRVRRAERAAPALDFLKGVKVLVLGDGMAGTWAGEIFSTLGAAVARLGSGPADPFREMLEAGWTALRSDTFVAALAEFGTLEVVICDQVSSVPYGFTTDLGEYEARVADRNPGVWVTISAFGLSGPRAGQLASDFIVAAASGAVAHTKDGDLKQRPMPGEQTLMAAGQAAVLAALQGLERRRLQKTNVHMDVSAAEAMIATGAGLQCSEPLLRFKVPGGIIRFGAPYGPYPCTDGIVYIAASEQHHWEAVARVIGVPELGQEIRGYQARIENMASIEPLVHAWTTARTKLDCEVVLQAAGVPATAMNSLDDVLAAPAFSARDQWVEAEAGDRRAKLMSSPFVARTDVSPDGHGDGAALQPVGLSELKVAEASHILAASVAGALLGAMGAKVTKLEVPDRLDSYRNTGPFIDGKNDIEWSGYFAIANHSKASRVCATPEELEEAMAGADIVMENWGYGRATRAGIDSAAVVRRWPSKLAISVSGFGHTSPQRSYRVYAYSLSAYCGVFALLEDDPAKLPRLEFAWADFTTSYSLAILVAAWSMGAAIAGRRSPGLPLDISMAEVVVERLNPQLLSHQVVPAAQTVWQNGSGGEWVLPTDGATRAVAVRAPSEADLACLVEVLGAPSTSGGWDLEALSALTKDVEGRQLADELVAAGLDAAFVLDGKGLVEDPHFVERGFFTEVDHPDWGRRGLIGLPWRFAGEGAIPLRPPPRLGDQSN